MKHILFISIWLFTSLQQIIAQSWTGSIRIELGAEEKVFEYVKDHCAELDLPDVYAHAIRTPSGIVLVSGNAPDNYFMFGKDFNSLKRLCAPVLRSGDKWPVDSFDHQEWITSVYSEDGITIHALVHNEYHDPYALNCKPGITDPSNPCWYNFISYAVSTDSGKTFTQPASPYHLVAMLPFKWNPSAVRRGAPPPHGYMEPSNIFKHNGYYYCMMFGILSNTDQGMSGTCIMRTQNLAEPSSWKIWDGNGFSIPLINPYTNPPADSSKFFPAFVSHRTIRGLRGSLTWSTYLNQFILIGAGVYPVGGREVCGFFFSRSDDLINWIQPQLIRQAILGWSPCDQQTPDQAARNIIQEAYPSLIDHDAPDLSFTIVDSIAYLYFMQNMDNHNPGGWGLRRDLVRIPIRMRKENTTFVTPEINSQNNGFLLFQASPNPFSLLSTIRWQSAVSGHTKLIIYDVLGREVKTLLDEFKQSGSYDIHFEQTELTAGIYYCKLQVGQVRSTIKMVIFK